MSGAAYGEIERTFAMVLEKQVFMFAEPIDPAGFDPGGGAWLAVTMGFSGEFPGRVLLAAPEAMAPEVAANFLGVDSCSEAAIAEAPDAIKELLNILCGNLLTALAGVEPVFELTTPRVAPLPGPEAIALAGEPGVQVFQVDDHCMLLRVDLDVPGGTSGWRGRKT